MEETKKKRMRKAAAPKAKKAEVPSKEDALIANMDVIHKDIEEVEAQKKSLQDALADKVYSYPKTGADRVIRRRTFKYKDRTEEDIIHFTKQIVEAWDSSPIDSRIHFMLSAFPAMRAFLKKHDPSLLMVMMHEAETEIQN